MKKWEPLPEKNLPHILLFFISGVPQSEKMRTNWISLFLVLVLAALTVSLTAFADFCKGAQNSPICELFLH